MRFHAIKARSNTLQNTNDDDDVVIPKVEHTEDGFPGVDVRVH